MNTLKEGSGKGADVTVTLQLVRQLASAPRHLRDPYAILAALQKLADEARVSGDPSAPRYEGILRQTRPFSSSVEFGDIIIRLVGSKEESGLPILSPRCLDIGVPMVSIPTHDGIRRNPRLLMFEVFRRAAHVGGVESVLTVVSAGIFKDSVLLSFYLKKLSLKFCGNYLCFHLFSLSCYPFLAYQYCRALGAGV